MSHILFYIFEISVVILLLYIFVELNSAVSRDSNRRFLAADVARERAEEQENETNRQEQLKEAERFVLACPLCNGERIFYGTCIYCFGYGEAHRSEEAERRFWRWAAEVRERWCSTPATRRCATAAR